MVLKEDGQIYALIGGPGDISSFIVYQVFLSFHKAKAKPRLIPRNKFSTQPEVHTSCISHCIIIGVVPDPYIFNIIGIDIPKILIENFSNKLERPSPLAEIKVNAKDALE